MIGDAALMFGARGGVYIAGGIVPKLGSRFADSAFRERFEAKGRMRPYLAAIPTYVVTHPRLLQSELLVSLGKDLVGR